MGAGIIQDQAVLDEARAIRGLLKALIAQQEVREAIEPVEPPHEIVLIVEHQTDEARWMPRGKGDGKLVSFMADGEPATPPTESMTELYRWLMDHDYEPVGFKWMGKALNGLRRRRQTYTLNGR